MHDRFQVGQPAPQVIGALQDYVERVGCQRPLRAARPIEDRFGLVSQFLHFPQFQEAGETFDRMKAPENRIESLRSAGIAFQQEQLRFDRGEMIAALEDEIAQKFLILR